jgi:uncharacterized protein YhdP
LAGRVVCLLPTILPAGLKTADSPLMPTDAFTPSDTSRQGATANQPTSDPTGSGHAAPARVRQALGWVGRGALVLYFIFCFLFLRVRYVVLPNVGQYKARVEKAIGRAIGQPVSIGKLGASWSGLTPRVLLTDVTLHDAAGVVTMRLPQVSAALSWWSVTTGTVRLDRLELDRPELRMWRDRDGRLYVGGLFIDIKKPGDGRALDWLLSQHRITIHDATIDWTDVLRGSPTITLQQVSARLENNWNSHAFAVRAVPPAELAAPIDLRGAFRHPAFSGNASDFRQWQGVLYANLRSPDLTRGKTYVDYPIRVAQGRGALRTWLSFDHNHLIDLTSDLQLADVTAQLAPELPWLELSAVTGRVSIQSEPDLQPTGVRKLLSPLAITIGKPVPPKPVPPHNDSDKSQIAEAEPQLIQSLIRMSHAVALIDFSMTTKEGAHLPPTTVREKYTVAVNGRPQQTTFSATLLELEPLARFAQRLPLPLAHRKMLKDFAPHGTVKDFSATLKGSYPNLAGYEVKGTFSNLGLLAQQVPILHAVPPIVAVDPAQRQPPALITAQPAILPKPGIPGFDHLTGSIDANERGGRLNLDSNNLVLELPGIVTEPTIRFDKLALQSSWTIQNKNQLTLDIGALQFVKQGLRGNLSGTHKMALSRRQGDSLGVINVKGTVTGLELAKIDDYLPLATPDHLRQWLKGALLGGVVQDATLRVKGDLANFPFKNSPRLSVMASGSTSTSTSHPTVVVATVIKNTTAAGPQSDGQFTVSGRIENGKLDIAPDHLAKDGKSRLWPLIEAVNGKFAINRTSLEINASSARIHQVDAVNVKAVIADVLSADRVLSVDGTARGGLQDLVGFVNDSPVADWIGHFTQDTHASGDAILGLQLQLPLARLRESKVQGSLQLASNDVSLQPVVPPMTQATGKLEFNEKGIALNNIKANFAGGPVSISGGTQPDGAIVIKAEGAISSDGLRRSSVVPAIQTLAAHFDGATRYAATIAVRKKQLEIQVDSSLQGMAMDLPAPLKKSAAEALPVKFQIAGLAAPEGMFQDEVKLDLGSALAAHYLRQKSTDKEASWRVIRGGIGVNVPPPQPDSGVNINVDLRSLNIDAWRNLIASITRAAKAAKLAPPASGTVVDPKAVAGATGASGAIAEPNNPVDPKAAAANATNATNSDDVPEIVESSTPIPAPGGLAQYLDPEVLSAHTTELIVGGKKLDNVVVGVSHQKGVWQANIDAAQANGYVTWNESRSGLGLGKVTARLSSLIIPKTSVADVSEILEGKTTVSQIPALDIIADQFELFGKQLGRVELSANNGRATGQRDWRINKLQLTNPDAELKASGSWSHADASDSMTNLSYQLDIVNAGKLLERFGFANVIKGGKGVMEGDVRWAGLPFALDIPSLGGQMRIDMAAGQFLKVDPGAAKLLGVLSLQSLPRRLTLDFRDVFSEGFAFDGITGDVAIAQGTAKTDNLKMRSVTATVVMDGSADIAHENQNLHVAVIPEINVGTASVVYALAVNPVIGLGTFLAQLFLREPLMRAFTFEYKITGPWKAPQVLKVNRHDSETPAGSMPRVAPQANAG